VSVQSPRPPVALPVATEGPPQRIYGVIDLIRSNRIAGWAVDRANSHASVLVDIHRDGRLVQTIAADQLRPDLAKGSIGTGHYGFAAEIEPPLEPGFEFTLAATARAADGSHVPLKILVPAEDKTPLDIRMMQGIHTGVQALLHRQTPTRQPPDPMIDRLAEMVTKLEVMQARIEARLPETRDDAPHRSDRSLRGIVYFTALVAIGSLCLGVASFWPG
jgi:hypothetical protein